MKGNKTKDDFYSRFIRVGFNNRILLIPYESIVYIQVGDQHVAIFLNNGEIVRAKTNHKKEANERILASLGEINSTE